MSSLKDKAYEAIKQKIISCELIPGEIIEEKQLVEHMQYSRTPIREALNALAKEGLVDIIPRRGIFVAGITIKDINDIFILKQEIEPIILRMAAHRLSLDILKKYRNFFNSCMEPIEYSNKDSEFHNYIAMSCENKYLIQMMNIVYGQSKRIRNLTNTVGARMKESGQEHIEIIDYLLSNDINNAAEAMREHYVNSRENIMKFNTINDLIRR